jgi:hypothetical protein
MRAPISSLLSTSLVISVAAGSGCAAEAYVSEGPDYTTEPPKTVQVRVLGINDAEEPEAIAIDGRFVCHNYDPGRRELPKCPRFRSNADEVKFELETYVAVGEHRISVVGWGESSEIKTFKVFMADVPVLCQFDAQGVECEGVGTPSIIDSVDALMEEDAAAPAEPPPSLDAPTMDDGEAEPAADDGEAEPAAPPSEPE